MIRAVGEATWNGGNTKNETHEHYTYGEVNFLGGGGRGVLFKMNEKIGSHPTHIIRYPTHVFF